MSVHKLSRMSKWFKNCLKMRDYASATGMKVFFVVGDETFLVLQQEYIILISSVGLPLANVIKTNRCRIEAGRK